ncbi:MAG TPA: hypothetical protein VE710_14255 [Candidatus Bathyarchaeia archaeon]|nr:hypothetical protein [Candidatus Bathyarchaeia archaeon]
MVKTKVFLLCLTVIVTIFSMIICMELYALERSVARGIYTDVLDEMQDIGYLHSSLADYYKGEMVSLGWEAAKEDFFAGSSPRDEIGRARKERNEMVSLTMTIRPSRLSQWIHYVIEGETDFHFAGSRPSEYFDPGW